MTKWGDKLAGVDEEQLRQQLRAAEDPKAPKRLTSALLYLQGYSPAEIEQVLGFPEQTVHAWLDSATCPVQGNRRDSPSGTYSSYSG